MKVIAGGWEINRPVYADAKPTGDRTAAPADEVAKFMAKAKLFDCQLFAARITAKQCAINRGKKLFLCGKCTQERPAQGESKTKRWGKRRKGDNPASPWRPEPAARRSAKRTPEESSCTETA